MPRLPDPRGGIVDVNIIPRANDACAWFYLEVQDTASYYYWDDFAIIVHDSDFCDKFSFEGTYWYCMVQIILILSSGIWNDL